MFQHSSEDEGGKKNIENHETSCKLHKRKETERERDREREREREGNCRLIQERLQNEDQKRGNKEERKGGKALSIKE